MFVSLEVESRGAEEVSCWRGWRLALVFDGRVMNVLGDTPLKMLFQLMEMCVVHVMMVRLCSGDVWYHLQFRMDDAASVCRDGRATIGASESLTAGEHVFVVLHDVAEGT